MRLHDFEITPRSLAESGWEPVLKDHIDCFGAEGALLRAAQEAAESSPDKAQALSVLREACTLYLALDHPEALQPSIRGPEGRSTALEDFSQKQLEAFRQFSPDVGHHGLRSRLCDILWIRTRDYEMAKAAFDSYLLLADELIAAEKSTRARDHVARALQIAAELRSDDLKARVVAKLEELVDLRDNGKLVFGPWIMQLLFESKSGDASQRANIAEAYADETSAHAEWSRAYWDLAARWHGRAGDNESANTARTKAAETFASDAELHMKGDNSGALVAADQLTRAIVAMRSVSGTKDRVRELENRLAEIQPLTHESMHTVEHATDITEIAEAARASVRDLPLEESIFALANCARITDLDSLRSRVQYQRQRYPLVSLFPAIHLDLDGRIRARSSGGVGDAEDLAVEEQMITQLGAVDVPLRVAGQIDPARRALLIEHHIRVVDLLSLLAGCPFVPYGRQWTFARGLYCGLQGDFAVAASLLVPQLENALRQLLTMRGKISTRIDTSRIQQDFGLGAMLKTNQELRDALRDSLGEDLFFELRALLVEPLGGNLRNELAHGMLSDSQLGGGLSAYVWWLTLRLCVTPGFWTSTTTQPPRLDGGGENLEE